MYILRPSLSQKIFNIFVIWGSSSVAKDMDLGTIFRSSRSFKKAKLTASQLQLEDTESQPVDFVPDSLADP